MEQGEVKLEKSSLQFISISVNAYLFIWRKTDEDRNLLFSYNGI